MVTPKNCYSVADSNSHRVIKLFMSEGSFGGHLVMTPHHSQVTEEDSYPQWRSHILCEQPSQVRPCPGGKICPLRLVAVSPVASCVPLSCWFMSAGKDQPPHPAPLPGSSCWLTQVPKLHPWPQSTQRLSFPPDSLAPWSTGASARLALGTQHPLIWGTLAPDFGLKRW